MDGFDDEGFGEFGGGQLVIGQFGEHLGVELCPGEG